MVSGRRRTLIVLRHAKSAWDTDDIDVDRPLAERGRRDAVAAGRLLAELEPRIDLALVSTAKRAQQTWRRAQLGGAEAVRVESGEYLYGASSDELLSIVRTIPDEVGTALLLGHEPALSALVLTVSRPGERRDRVAQKFPTSAAAILRFDGSWARLAAGGAQLERFEVPRG